MKGEWRDYLVDILESAREVEMFIAGMSYDKFFRDKKTINAVIRSLEVMGEAAKRVPEEIRVNYPEIPWKRMAGMRDKLIHEYAGVDLETVWDVATEELPALKPILERLKDNLD
jgi:uncharacterized protein with HEPN domain